MTYVTLMQASCLISDRTGDGGWGDVNINPMVSIIIQ